VERHDVDGGSRPGAPAGAAGGPPGQRGDVPPDHDEPDPGDLHAPARPPTAPIHDLAYNATGRGFPRATASFTSRTDSVAQVADGRIAFTRASRNRWTAWGSPHRSDWVEVAFGARRTVRALDLYLWGDSGGVRAPRRFTVQYWDGRRWAAPHERLRMPQRPATWAMNSVRIDPVETDRIRVVFEHDLPAFSGMTELMVWDTLP